MSIDTPNVELDGPRQPRENQFRFVFNALAEHWLLITSLTVLLSCMLGGLALLRRETAVERFQSYAELVFKPSQWEKDILQGVGGMSLAISPRDLVERTSKRNVAEQVALALVHRDIAQGADYSRIATPQEFQALASDIERRLSLTAVDNSQRIRVEVTDCATPEEAETMAEFAARVFVDLNRQVNLTERKQDHAFVRGELEQLRQKLFEAEAAELAFKQRTGFRAAGRLDEEMAKMYNDLEELDATRAETEAKLEELDHLLAENAEQLPDALNNVTKGVVDQLFQELDVLLKEKLSMSQEFQPAFPGFVELEERIAEKQRAILDAYAQLDGGARGGSTVWEKRQGLYNQRMDLRLELNRLEIRIGTLERQLEEVTPKIPELANKNLEYEQLRQETQSIRERFNKLREREWEIRAALSHGTGQVERYEPVRQATLMPMAVAAGQVWVNFLIGAVVGFVAGFGIAMMLEANDTSIRSVEDVKEYIGLEVIGTIPKMRFGRPRGSRRRRATYVTTVDEERVDACIVTQHDPKSPISEAYRTLRTNYQFATIQEQPKTLMITSAVPGEGKTTTAVNMAVTMADRGIRVLLVDTDLRRPNVHRVLRMERGPGLADVLRQRMDPLDVVRSTRIENLSVVSSGRVPPNPSELIGSEQMARVMQRLSKEFDLIICDAPSVLVVTDPVLLATHVETCIMVVSTNNARRETVVRANHLLETANVNVVGVVVNGLETTRRHYYYYYYYYDEGAKSRRKWYHFY